MKRLIALGLASAVALGSVAATTSVASARYDGPRCAGMNCDRGGNWDKGNNWDKGSNWKGSNWKYRHGYNGGFLFPFIVGSAVGYGLGGGFAPSYDSGYGYEDSHVEWCMAHYRTYNPRTNMYFVRVGVPAVCYSPYDSY